MNEEHVNEVQPSKRGWKKTAIVMMSLLVAVIGGLLYLALPPREPSYQGKPLSYWLAKCEEVGTISADTKDPKERECREAIRHIGTNAIPALLRKLQAKDSALKSQLIYLIEKQDYFHF